MAKARKPPARKASAPARARPTPAVASAATKPARKAVSTAAAGGTTTTAPRRAVRPSASRSASLSVWRRGDVAVAVLLAVPVAIIPGGLNRFVYGKLLLAAIGVFLAFVAVARGRLPRAARGLLAGGCAVLLVAALASGAAISALLGRQPVNEGVLVLGLYALAVAAGARVLGPGADARTKRVAVTTMTAVVVAVAFVALLELFGLRPLSSDLDRPGSLLGTASDEGALCALYGAVLLGEALRTRDRVPVLGAVAAFATVAMSGSRGAVLGVVVAVVVLAVAGNRRTRRAAVGVVGALAVAALAIPETRDRLLGLSPLSGETASGRVLLWRESLSLFVHHPLFGVGPSQFERQIVGEHDRQWQVTVGPDNPPGSPHNIVLQPLLSGGVLLLAVCVALAVLVARAGWRSLTTTGWAVLPALAGYVTALMFHFTTPGTTVPAAVLAGGLLATEPAARERWARRVALPVAALLAAVYLLGAVAEIYLRLGSQAVADGHAGTADARFDTARMLRPWDVDLPAQVLHEFVTAARAGDRNSVGYATTWAKRVGPVADDEQVLDNRASLLDVTGDYAGAARLLDGALRRDPDDPTLLVLRGVIHARVGEYRAAVSVLRHATAIDPHNTQAWQDLAVVYRALGDTAAAADATRRATPPR